MLPEVLPDLVGRSEIVAAEGRETGAEGDIQEPSSYRNSINVSPQSKRTASTAALPLA